MPRTVITNVCVFDGTDRSSPKRVVLQDGVISAIAQSTTSPAAEDGDVTIDGAGCTLLPGLIDAHIHAHTVAALQRYLDFGLTTVLDMGAEGDVNPLRAASNLTANGLPTYRSAGTITAAPGSRHGRMIPESELVSSPDQAPAAVSSRFAAGSDYLKVIADLPGFDQPTLDALAAEARRAGKMCVAHAASYASYERALHAGVDVIAHVPLDRPLDDVVVEALKTSGTVVVPTLEMMTHLANGMAKDNPKINPGMGPQNLSKLHAAGIPICAGTDSNYLPPPMMRPFGETFAEELRLLVHAGMSPAEALVAATSRPAKVFGFEDRGAVAEGLRADLLLVEGDPVADISAVKNVRAVWVAGRQVRPHPL